MTRVVNILIALVLAFSSSLVAAAANATTGTTHKVTIYFDSHSSSLDSKDKAKIKKVIDDIKDATSIKVTGYVGPESSANSTLDVARAKSVKAYLKKLGVTHKVTIKGGGRPKSNRNNAKAMRATITYTLAPTSSDTISISGTFKFAAYSRSQLDNDGYNTFPTFLLCGDSHSTDAVNFPVDTALVSDGAYLAHARLYDSNSTLIETLDFTGNSDKCEGSLSGALNEPWEFTNIAPGNYTVKLAFTTGLYVGWAYCVVADDSSYIGSQGDLAGWAVDPSSHNQNGWNCSPNSDPEEIIYKEVNVTTQSVTMTSPIIRLAWD